MELNWYNTNYEAKYVINKLEYIFLFRGVNSLHSYVYGNNLQQIKRKIEMIYIAYFTL